MTTYKPGDVLRYTPRQHHAREGTAVVNENGIPYDTFWSSNDFGTLGPNERATAHVIANLNDYEPISEYREDEYRQRAPQDRLSITHQHGLQVDLYVRKGSEPDPATLLANAQAALCDAESDLRSALSSVEWRQRDVVTARKALADKQAEHPDVKLESRYRPAWINGEALWCVADSWASKTNEGRYTTEEEARLAADNCNRAFTRWIRR
jgi:hypothetical protein